jgi:hypothetical protein
MTMPETAAGIASVDQASTIPKMEINSFATNDGERRAIACIQAGPQKSTHRDLSFADRRTRPGFVRAEILRTTLGFARHRSQNQNRTEIANRECHDSAVCI